MPTIPSLTEGDVTIRPIRARDARALERELIDNRGWLRQWEATNPHGPLAFDVRSNIRSLQANARAGLGLPFAMDYKGEFARQQLGHPVPDRRAADRPIGNRRDIELARELA